MGMWKWVQKQWAQIRGNVKWQIVVWFFHKYGVVTLVTTTMLTIWTIVKHWPAVYWALIGCLIAMIAVWFLTRQPLSREIQIADHAPEKVLNLKLIPHGDNDTSAYIEVLNQGETATVDAQLRIVGLSTGRSFKKLSFVGKWRGEYAGLFTDHVRIESNKSCLLALAKVDPKAGLNEQEMTIVGIDGESVRWLSYSSQNQDLPHYSIQITLISSGYPKTVSATYKVGPKTSHGPFQMMEVTV